ncbi:MAG TPA: AraC family transcriptional regulator [Vicinamibacterales bacterium]|nr:AraC family transcriptional regulator [Vicinamibacterales bacterium]
MTTTRTPLFRSSTGLVERVECQVSAPSFRREEYSPDFQIAFPFQGAFRWYVGRDVVVSDPNQVLFIRGGETFRLGATRTQGFGELIITPDLPTLRDASETTGFDLEHHPLFTARSSRITPELQRVCLQMLHQWHQEEGGDLEASENLVYLLTQALRLSPPARVPSPQTGRLIRRAKEFLTANFREPLQLADVAAAAGGSPAYLTDVFRRCEGVPLHCYLTQLRLGRALLDVPHTNDLTALALDLGFSSHSHFTFSFRKLFGCTPSEFRRSTRLAMRTMPFKLEHSRDSSPIETLW